MSFNLKSHAGHVFASSTVKSYKTQNCSENPNCSDFVYFFYDIVKLLSGQRFLFRQTKNSYVHLVSSTPAGSDNLR